MNFRDARGCRKPGGRGVTMMGQPFEAIQIMGYDNMLKKFQTFWIDNTSTAFFLLYGTYDAAKKTRTDTTKLADPMRR